MTTGIIFRSLYTFQIVWYLDEKKPPGLRRDAMQGNRQPSTVDEYEQITKRAIQDHRWMHHGPCRFGSYSSKNSVSTRDGLDPGEVWLNLLYPEYWHIGHKPRQPRRRGKLMRWQHCEVGSPWSTISPYGGTWTTSLEASRKRTQTWKEMKWWITGLKRKGWLQRWPMLLP